MNHAHLVRIGLIRGSAVTGLDRAPESAILFAYTTTTAIAVRP